MTKFKTSEERRAKAMKILARGGHLPPCKKCGEPDDRRAEDGLCKKCNLKAEKAERERQRLIEEQLIKDEAERERLAKYNGRAGSWA